MKQYTEYVSQIYAHCPKADPEKVERLYKIARLLQLISERQCNGYSNRAGNWDERAEKRDERKATRLHDEAEEIAKDMGGVLYFQGDPRGWPLFIYFPGMEGYQNPRGDGGWHGIGIPPR